MVKQSFEIYKRDLKIIFTNYTVLITIIALCILPSLYALINIKASWDPYSSEATSRIKVAVVNNDIGAVLNEKTINIGQEVVAGLKENNLLGWQFLDEEEAMQYLKEGKVYATIIIPNNFSSDLTSFITSTIKEPQIKYIVNEKLNAIAPKITIKGASGIQTTVSQELITTVSKVVLNMARELGIEVEDVILPKLMQVENALVNIKDKFKETNSFIDSTQTGVNQMESFVNEIIDYMPRMETLLSDSQDMMVSIKKFLNTTEEGLNMLAPTIKKDIGLISEITGEANSYIDSLEAFIRSGSEKIPEMVSNLLTEIEGAEELTNSLIKILQAIDKLSLNQEIKSAITRFQEIQTLITNIKEDLTQLNEAVQDGITPDLTLLSKIKSILEDVQNISSGLYEEFDVNIMESINSIFEQVNKVVADSGQMIQDIEEIFPDASNLLVKAQEIMQKGNYGLGEIKTAMPSLEEKVNLLTERISEVNKSKQLKDILALVKEDVEQRTKFLADGTCIVEETIFPMGNYGSQMSPFYSSLASWVGLTILVSMLSVDVKGEYTRHEVYLGKLLTYMTITFIQGMIIALGNLYLLKIHCLRPWLFILGMLYITIAFTLIVYSLVSVFGNIGKVIAIILMILQVAAAGGTFPVQLTSQFFIAINPYLPFTYAISLLREAIGGIEESVLIKDIGILGGFSLASIILALLLKPYMNKILGGFTRKFHEGGL